LVSTETVIFLKNPPKPPPTPPTPPHPPPTPPPTRPEPFRKKKRSYTVYERWKFEKGICVPQAASSVRVQMGNWALCARGKEELRIQTGTRTTPVAFFQGKNHWVPEQKSGRTPKTDVKKLFAGRKGRSESTGRGKKSP